LSDSVHAHHVVIVGAGFGGLEVARRLAGAPVRITIIDQCNYHLFQPLLYQVATASLATSEIAWPVRHLLRKRKEVTTLLAVVSGIDIGDGKVLLEDGGVVAAPKLGLWLARPSPYRQPRTRKCVKIASANSLGERYRRPIIAARINRNARDSRMRSLSLQF
jgi:NADPH-dependent 2,4-dienoyl-CoA reductase/sulfur reductase-like enzyme